MSASHFLGRKRAIFLFWKVNTKKKLNTKRKKWIDELNLIAFRKFKWKNILLILNVALQACRLKILPVTDGGL